MVYKKTLSFNKIVEFKNLGKFLYEGEKSGKKWKKVQYLEEMREEKFQLGIYDCL
jgi:translation initiation factor IF-3